MSSGKGRRSNEAVPRSQGRLRARLWLVTGLCACGGAEPGPGKGDGAAPAALPDGLVILDHAHLIDALTDRPAAALLLSEGLIWDVREAGQAWPIDAQVIDLEGAVVVPGLIDAHVHLALSGATVPVGDTLEANLRAQLAWGVLGVADLGAPAGLADVAAAVDTGALVGPRIWSAGRFLTAVGSHPCEVYNDRSLCVFVDEEGGSGEAAVDPAALLARARGRDGAKVALADAAFSPWPTPRLDLGDLALLVEAADAAGIPVVAHVDTEADAEDALAAGVSLLAHPVFDAPLARAPEGTVMSTLGAFQGTGALLDGSLLADDTRYTPAAVRAVWQALYDAPGLLAPGWAEGNAAWALAAAHNLNLARDQGVPVLAGSDAGYWFVPHGLGLHRELEALVAAGWSPAEALRAATLEPALALGWADQGLLSPGYRADLLVLGADPRQDVRALRDIRGRWIGGRLWSPDDPLRPAEAAPLSAAAGEGCVAEADCAPGLRCDGVDHRCAPACDPPYDRVGACDADSACLPADGAVATDGVCRPLEGCDLYAQDCSPARYGEACVPVDLDTNRCWPVGSAGEGDACSWTDPALGCEAGLLCSWIDSRCYRLCDPALPPEAGCAACEEQQVEGQGWFGLCLPLAGG